MTSKPSCNSRSVGPLSEKKQQHLWAASFESSGTCVNGLSDRFSQVSEANWTVQKNLTRREKWILRNHIMLLLLVFSFLTGKTCVLSPNLGPLLSELQLLLLVIWNNCFHGNILATFHSRIAALVTFALLGYTGNGFDKQKFLRVVLKEFLTMLKHHNFISLYLIPFYLRAVPRLSCCSSG